MINTKDTILLKATELFAKDGYNGVSVRAIARAAGITEGSIYNHFASKQEILDEILEKHAKQLKWAMPTSQQLIDAYKKDDWKPAWAHRIYMLEHELDKVDLNIIRILTSEQYRNEKASEIVLKYYIDAPIKITYDLFVHLRENGQTLPADPMVLARTYQYPLFGLTQEYAIHVSLNNDLTPIIAKIKSHIKFFWKNIMKRDFDF